MTTLGDITVLDRPAIGFLCSNKAQSGAILPCLDWAVKVSKGDTPIISTFHSELERAVLDVLLRGKCPIILVLGRKLYKHMPEHLQHAYDSGRLIFVSLSDAPRITRATAHLCNDYICLHSAYLTFGYVAPDSSLRELYDAHRHHATIIM